MIVRSNYSSGAPWEDEVGYSRAVKIGNQIEVSGTVAVRDGKVVHRGDAYLQTKEIIKIAEEALMKAGSSLLDVIRTRILVTDIKSQWKAVGQAHGEAFKDIKPATTMVEVGALIHEDYLLEIEFTAICSS